MYLKANSPAVAHHGKTVIGFNWIAGKEAEGDLPSFDARSAVDSRDTVGIFPECGERDVERAAKAAAAAGGPWSATPAARRAAVIGRVGEVLAANADRIAAIITRELGWPVRTARTEVAEALEACRRFQDTGDADPIGPGAGRRPLGVVALLTGAASPLAAPAWKLMAALAAGDTVVWKPSGDAPTTAYLLVRAMMDAGLDPGVVNVVNGRGRGACGKALMAGIARGLFRKVDLCGSPALGRAIAETAGRALVPCSLELTGRNPMIVLADAPVEAAAAAALAGAFTAAGQRRAAIGNLILHRDVSWAFREAFMAGLQELAMGNPVADPEVVCGPMVNARCARAFLDLVAMGRQDGARLLTGGEAWTEDSRSPQVHGPIAKGCYLQPCVWDEVTPEMRLFRAEAFGPAVNLVVVDDFDQALGWALASPFPAAGFLHTADPEAIGRFQREFRGRVCVVNDTDGTWTGNGDAERSRDWAAGWTRARRLVGAPEAGDGPAPEPAQHPYEPSRWNDL
jgi:aldehyde dehydrogenase (NAD+)